jgi:hypothetical protein
VIPFSTTLLHGLLICLPFTIFALVSFHLKPRLWLHSLPPDIQRLSAPKTASEIKLTRWVLLPVFLLILPGLSVLSTFYVASSIHIDLSFQGALLHLYSIWIIVHLWDFLVIDCGFALVMNPQHPPIAGTEGAKGWRDYGFHFRSLLKAVVFSALFVVPAAALIAWFV